MDFTNLQNQIQNLKTILPSVVQLGENLETLLTSEQKAQVDKLVAALKAIPIVEMEVAVSETYDKLQKDVTLTKGQLVLAGTAIAMLVHLLHKK